MAYPTRDGSSDASHEPDASAGRPIRGRLDQLGRPGPLRRTWAPWSAIGAGVVTLFLLFRPWLKASGPDGHARTDAFGRIEASTLQLTAWSQQHNSTPQISGAWAILAATAIVAMCVLALVSIRARTEAAARYTALCAVVSAALVLITLVYINAQAADLKAMTARKYDMGGQIGSFMAWVFGNGSPVVPGLARKSFSTAALTPWGMVACALMLMSAVAVVVQWAADHPAGRMRLRFRSPIVPAAESKRADSPPAD
ncbi:hypothetical protein [Nocardia veterana]|uniref:Uncharacterized protein n=1 Tax=Nocardia veterana TaxID=132249 RepID=A0A7X6RJA8_9NOCA|nr:hypothetical protein [Nocardia veterana]NKY88010.1 hypothetical protein [Nocardia veterana]